MLWFVGGVALGFVLGYVLRTLRGFKGERGEDGILTLKNKAVNLNMKIPVQELLDREYVSFTVYIPDLKE